MNLGVKVQIYRSKTDVLDDVGGGFLTSTPQAALVNYLLSDVVTGDEVPAAGANGFSFPVGEAAATTGAGKIISNGTEEVRLQVNLTNANQAGALVSGNTYVAHVDVDAFVGASGSALVGFQFGGSFWQPSLVYSGSGIKHTGVSTLTHTVASNHSAFRLKFGDGAMATCDNLGLIDITSRLTRDIDVYIVAGQSNAAGNANGSASGLTPAEAAFDPRVMVVPASTQDGSAGTALTNAERIEAMCNPLQHQTSVNGVGPGVSFGSALADRTPEDRLVVLIPAAWAGTSLVAADGLWNRTGSDPQAYNGAVSLVSNFLTAYPNATVRGMLWCQGESDGGAASAAQYQTKFETDIAAPFRALWGNFPIVLLGMLPENTTAFTNIDPQLQAIAAADSLISYVAGVSGATIASEAPSFVHYSIAGQQTNGVNCANALFPLLESAWGS